MKFNLSAHLQADGLYHATLFCDGEAIATRDDLKSVKNVRGWAQDQAEDYKNRTTPEPSESHTFSRAFHV